MCACVCLSVRVFVWGVGGGVAYNVSHMFVHKLIVYMHLSSIALYLFVVCRVSLVVSVVCLKSFNSFHTSITK